MRLFHRKEEPKIEKSDLPEIRQLLKVLADDGATMATKGDALIQLRKLVG